MFGITLSNHIIIFQNTMSLIAASQEDIDEGKHAALADLYFLLTLDASLVDAAEKQASKNELLEGIKKHSALKSLKLFFFFFHSFLKSIPSSSLLFTPVSMFLKHPFLTHHI